MPKLPKGLYPRGSIFWTKVYQHGRPIYQSTGTSNLTEAKRILDVRRGAAQRGESVLPRVDRVRWEEAQADLIAYYEATGKREVAEAKSRVAHLGLYFTGWRIARIDTPAIHGYVVHRKQQKAAAATINRELATLSKALRVAHQNKKLTGHPSRIEKLLLRAGAVRGGAETPARLRQASSHIHVPHGVADQERGAAPSVAAGGLPGRHRAPGAGNHQEQGRPVVLLAPRAAHLPGGPARGHRGGSAPDGAYYPVGVPLRGDTHEELLEGMEDCLQGRRGSWADPTRLPPDGRQEPGARRGAAVSRHENG